jgi:hypothetical protein
LGSGTQQQKYLLSGQRPGHSSGFYYESSLGKADNSKSQIRDQAGHPNKGTQVQVQNSTLKSIAPQVQPHLSASMLSVNPNDQPNRQRSAVEAVMARKDENERSQKNFFDDTIDDKQSQKQNAKESTPIMNSRGRSFGGDSFRGSKEKGSVRIQESSSKKQTGENTNLEQKLAELSKMPGIHEMALGYYCPPPLFYHKVREP